MDLFIGTEAGIKLKAPPLILVLKIHNECCLNENQQIYKVPSLENQ